MRTISRAKTGMKPAAPLRGPYAMRSESGSVGWSRMTVSNGRLTPPSDISPVARTASSSTRRPSMSMGNFTSAGLR